MVDSLPDSTLALLRKVDCDNLSAKDMAEYSLLFTMAQDKSGLDVDNDSLIRIAMIGISSIKTIRSMQNVFIIWVSTIC